MMQRAAILAIILGTVLAGCTGLSPSPEPGPLPDVHYTPQAEVAVTAIVEDVQVHNVTDRHPETGRQTVAPDDTATLNITRVINRTTQPSDADIDTSIIQEEETIDVPLTMGARPAVKIHLPKEEVDTETGAQSTESATTEWAEWEDGRFVFKQKMTTVDERTVINTLPGLEEGYLIRTHITVNEDASVSVADYSVY